MQINPAQGAALSVSPNNLSRIFFILLLFTSVFLSKAQYPYEKYDSIKYLSFNDWKLYDWIEKKHVIHQTLSVPNFYSDLDTMTIQLTSFDENWDSSYMRIFRNKEQIQKIFEPMAFTDHSIWGPLIVADFNGDTLSDIKINVAYMGCGLASMNCRIIYLFQRSDGSFRKISYMDKLESGNRVERDFNNDGNFEIITMTLKGYEGHSYWTFDLFNYQEENFQNVDDEFGYPIMIQFLFRQNYDITDKISREKMKDFKLIVPKDIDIK